MASLGEMCVVYPKTFAVLLNFFKGKDHTDCKLSVVVHGHVIIQSDFYCRQAMNTGLCKFNV